MIYETLTKIEAKEIMDRWRYENTIITTPTPSIYDEIKSKLEKNFQEAARTNDVNSYKFDLSFGLELYNILNNEYGMTEREASNDEVWAHLSVCVVPHLVEERWGFANDVRSYKQSNRIWLKTLWWYVHLSWQGTLSDTLDILKNNTTDDIVQLVERTGKVGFDVTLYRTIMDRYAKEKGSSLYKASDNVFRKIMVLNTMYVKTIEPMLYQGGYQGYVEMLFASVKGNYEENKYLAEKQADELAGIRSNVQDEKRENIDKLDNHIPLYKKWMNQFSKKKED